MSNLSLTEDGKILLAKAQLGKELHFTRVGLGDGEPIAETKNMISEKMSTDIKKKEVIQENIVSLLFVISNENLEEGFNWRELGVYAKDPDTQEEKLYAYRNSGDSYEYIPSKTEHELIAKHINLNLAIDNAETVNVTVDDNVIYITKEDVLQNMAGNTEEEYKVPSMSLLNKVLQLIFPIGSQYTTQEDIDPNKILGFGSWERLKGRLLIGLDEDDSDFNEIGKTGGAKTHKLTTAEMPSHTHVQNSHTHAFTGTSHTHTQNSHAHTIGSHTHTFTGVSHSHTFTGKEHTHTFTGKAHRHEVHSRVNSSGDKGDGQFMIASVGNPSAGTNYYNLALDTNKGIVATIPTNTAVGTINATAGGTNASTTATGTIASAIATGANSSVSPACSSVTPTNQSATAGGTNSSVTATNKNAGDGEAHNNMSPYRVAGYMWVRVA